MRLPQRNRLIIYGLIILCLSSCTMTPAPPLQDSVPLTPVPAATDQAGRPLIFGAFRYEEQTYKPLIEKYNREVGAPIAKLLIFEDLPDYPQQFSADFSLAHFVASHADVSSTTFFDQEDLQAGYLYDLTSLVDADAAFDRADFLGHALATATVDGKLYMVPHTITEQPFYYNRALWQQRHIPLPRPDWSWAEFLDILRRLPGKLPTGEETYGYAHFGNPYPMFIGALSESAALRHEAQQGTLQLTSPEVTSLFAQMVDLAQTKAIVLPNTAASDAPPNRTGLWIAMGGGRSGFATARPPVQVGTIAAPLNPSFNPEVSGYVMSAVTPDPPAAWKLLTFLSHQAIPYEADLLIMPARSSIAEKIQFWQQLDPETATVLRVMLARPYQPIDPKLRSAATQLSVVFPQVLDGTSQTAALRAAQKAYQADLAAQQIPKPALPHAFVVPTDAPQTAITIAYASIMGDMDKVQSLARDFQRDHPDIHVNLLSDVPSRQVADLAAAFDCFPSFGPPTASDAPLLADLTPFREADQQFDLKLYDPLALSVLTHAGKLTGLPLEVSYRFLAINQDRARQLGVAQLADSIDSYRQLTAFLALLPPANPKQNWYPLVSTDVVADSLMLLELQGIATLDMRNGSAQPRLNTDAVINGTRMIAALLANGEGSTLKDVTEPGIVATQRFLDGKALMLLTDQWNPLRVTDIPIRVVALTAQPTPINAVTTTSLHISATSIHADACWQWIRFLTTHNPPVTMPFPALSAAVAELDAPLQQVGRHSIQVAPR